jgi:pyruvate kinase
MLSNETAIGKYPSATVRMMRKIIAEIEESKMFRESIERSAELLEGNISDAIAYSATEVSRLTGAKLIICATESGKTAILISKHKPNIPILALTPFEETLRFLNLKWGVFTFKVRVFKSVDEILSEGPKIAKELHLIKSGEVYVITAGSHAGISGSTNLLKVDKA